MELRENRSKRIKFEVEEVKKKPDFKGISKERFVRIEFCIFDYVPFRTSSKKRLEGSLCKNAVVPYQQLGLPEIHCNYFLQSLIND